MAPKIALITGGNGITGSAIVEYLVKNTTKEEWSQIVVTSRSPFLITVEDPRITFIALDFSEDPATLKPKMKDICTPVTHAYFSSYVHKDDFVELNTANRALFENFLSALLEVAPKLENCTLQTGGKYYDVHLRPVPSPCREDDPRPGPLEQNFYYPQEDFLMQKQKGQSWGFLITRPEAIIGHTSKPNGMNSALTYALYFLICKELGEEARMPTNQLYWRATEDCSDTDVLAAFTIWASTTSSCQNQSFNVVNGDHFVWRYMWPRLASFLGANASSEQEFSKPVPEEGEVQQELSLLEWSQDKRPVWDSICEKANLPEAKATFDAATWAFQDWVFQRSWGATVSMSKARKFGWTGYKDSYDSITETFEKFRALRQIP